MKKNIKLNIIIFCLLTSISCYSQNKSLVNNLNIFQKDSVIDFSFAIDEALIEDSFTVFIDIKSKNRNWNSKPTLIGDFGKVSKLGTKHIYWTPIQDSIVLDELISFTIYINPVLKINKKKHLLKSTLFPGLGDYNARNGSLYAIEGVFAYGGVFSAILLQNQANESYRDYKNEFDLTLSEKKYDEVLLKRNLSYASIGISTLIWSVDLILLNRKINKMRKNVELSNHYLNLQNKIYIDSSNFVLLNTKTEFDLLIEKANIHFNINEYDQALFQIEKAELIRPKGSKALSELKSAIQIELKKIEANEIKFENLVANAIKLSQDGEYLLAKTEYKNAWLIFPDKVDLIQKNAILDSLIDVKNTNEKVEKALLEAKERISAGNFEDALTLLNSTKKIQKENIEIEKLIKICDTKIEEKLKLENDRVYNQYIFEIKTLIKNKEFDEAIETCKNALDDFAESAELRKLLAQSEKMLKDLNLKNYNLYIEKADNYWNNKMYDEAKTNYELALVIFPKESYPKLRIEKINQLNDEKVIASKSLATIFNDSKTAVFFLSTPNGSGTGFFVSSSGIAISCYHVFEGNNYKDCEVILSDNTKLKVEKILAQDIENDYIIFKVNINNKKINHLKIAKENPLQMENVLAIGFPDGGKEVFPENGTINLINNKQITHNANITYGNSGGPLLNQNGEVIGINSGGKVIEVKEYKFAINIQALKKSLQKLGI